MNPSMAPVTSEQERRELFAVYLSLPQLHHMDFEEVLRIPPVLGCLRNTLEAVRRRLAKRKAAAAVEAAQPFQLTP